MTIVSTPGREPCGRRQESFELARAQAGGSAARGKDHTAPPFDVRCGHGEVYGEVVKGAAADEPVDRVAELRVGEQAAALPGQEVARGARQVDDAGEPVEPGDLPLDGRLGKAGCIERGGDGARGGSRDDPGENLVLPQRPQNADVGKAAGSAPAKSHAELSHRRVLRDRAAELSPARLPVEAHHHVHVRVAAADVLDAVGHIAVVADEIALAEVGAVLAGHHAHAAADHGEELLCPRKMRRRAQRPARLEGEQVHLEVFDHRDRGKDLDVKALLVGIEARDALVPGRGKSAVGRGAPLEERVDLHLQALGDLPHRGHRRVHLAAFYLRKHRLGHPAFFREHVEGQGLGPAGRLDIPAYRWGLDRLHGFSLGHSILSSPPIDSGHPCSI